jgi:predicted permease
MLRIVRSRLRSIFQRGSVETELDEELRDHLDRQTEAYLAVGVSPADARLAARRDFGNVAVAKDACRDARGVNVLYDLAKDCRYALTRMRRTPGFTAAVVLTVAIGIGATTAIFSIVSAVILRPLPYRDPSRLVMLWTDDPKHAIHEEGVSYPNFADWRRENQSFEEMALVSRNLTATLGGGEDPEPIRAAVVSPTFFDVLGVAPAVGRAFSDAEANAREKVVVLSHALWLRRFGGSPDAIGTMLELDGIAWRITGVMPGSFRFPDADTAVWLAQSAFRNWPDIERNRYSDWGRVIARMKPGVSLVKAQAEMTDIGQRLARTYPVPASEQADFAGFAVNVVPLAVQILGRDLAFALWVLFAGVVSVLLIACANVASLLLASGAARGREIAIRRSLGAGSERIFRQLLTEGVVLAVLAGLLGFALAAASVPTLIVLGLRTVPRLEEVSIDGRVLVFTIALSLLSVLLFGLAPALHLANQPAPTAGRGASPAPARTRMRRLLVSVQCALSIVLLAATGLLIRSFLNVEAIDPGFQPGRALTMRLEVPGSDRSALDFYTRALERLQKMPGVTRAGVVEDVLQRRNPDYGIVAEAGESRVMAPLAGDAASPGFFQTIGVPVVKGRSFSTDDRAGAPPVAIVNETMARRFWPGESGVGKRFRASDAEANEPWTTVVGVVADMRRQGLEREPIAQVFWPHAQRPVAAMDLVVRTSADPAALAHAVREEIRALDRRVTVSRIGTLEQLLDDSVSPRRFQTWLLALFAAIALMLAAIGVYGLMHYAVVQRTHEIGIRVALGARTADVLRMILSEGWFAVLLGMAIGMLASLWITPVLARMLVGVTPHDPLTLSLVAVVLGGAAAVACSVPGYAATRIDPLVALREE